MDSPKKKPNKKLKKKRKSTNNIEPGFCTMCDIRIIQHIGELKCPTCNCWTCEKYIEDFKTYGVCPGCYVCDVPCIVCGVKY